MKSLSTWIIALSAISFVACDSTDDPVEAGTEVAGGAEGGVMTGGVMTGGVMTGGVMTGGVMTGGVMTGGVAGDMGGEMAGVMTGGVDVPGGVMTGPGCTEPLEVGVSCDVFNDCCARGTQCTSLAADGSDPVCLRRCDANAEISGCEARELCNPESGDVPPDQESPGTCIPGDDCEPGNENLACGEGEYYCQRVQNITLCFGDLAEVRAQAPELIVGAGEACNPFDNMAPTYCEPGLVCEYGVCRDTCETDADCAEGSECADYTSRVDGIPYKFCLDSCDVYTQDCPNEGDVCILGDSYDGAIVGLCEGAAGPSGTGVSGDECTESDTNYWGTCEASNLCTQLSEDGPSECVSFCDDYNLEACGRWGASPKTTCIQMNQPSDATARTLYDAVMNYAFTQGNDYDAVQDAQTACTDNTDCNTARENADTCMQDTFFDLLTECASDSSTTQLIVDTWQAQGDSCFYPQPEDHPCTLANLSCAEVPACTSAIQCARSQFDAPTRYQACAFVLAIDDVGLCLGECNIFTQEGCDEGQECQLFNEGVNANDEPVAFGSCVENSFTERVMTGDACEGEPIEIDGMMRENPFVSTCPPNHYCGDTTGDGVSTCIAACDPTNVANTGCPEGISCRVVFDGIESFGLCL
jgi:hypothetical protein